MTDRATVEGATWLPMRVPHAAHQAIRDGQGRTIGFELFYRDSEVSVEASERTTAATLQVLADHFVSPRIDQRYLYFVNVTCDLMAGRIALPDLPVTIVLELPPEGQAGPAVVAGAARFRERGEGVALDRYLPGRDNGHDQLLPFASHVKLDLDESDDAALEAAAAAVRSRSNAILIATKIGTDERYARARELGCDLFQGWAVEDVQHDNQKLLLGSLTQYTRLLGLLAVDDDLVDMGQVSKVVASDPDLSFRVLRACNSASVGLREKLTSIPHALSVLGLRRLRRIVYLAVAQGLAVNGSDRLLGIVAYALFTDLVGGHLGLAPGSGFLVGLLDQVAEVTETPVAEVLRTVPLADDLADGLRQRTGLPGRALQIIDGYRQPNPVASTGPDAPTMAQLGALHLKATLEAAGITEGMDQAAGDAVLSIALPPVWTGPDDLASGRPVPSQAGPESIVGPAPAPEAVEEAWAWNAWSQERARQQVRSASVTLDRLQSALGLDDRQFHLLRGTNRLLAVALDDQEHVPLWQFAPTGGLLDGLEDVIALFPGDALALAEWLIRPSRALGGRLPILLLAQGEAEVVLEHVRGMPAW